MQLTAQPINIRYDAVCFAGSFLDTQYDTDCKAAEKDKDEK